MQIPSSIKDPKMRPGTKVGRYEIISEIGAGGMGEVYRARDTRLKREVAIKVLSTSFSSNPERLRRFEAEAQAAGALNHPNILVVHDVGAHEGAPFIVSELLEGQTLRARLSEQPLTQRMAISYALQIVKGLSAAHKKGITHRDLKPDNIFITRDGRVKILDFGLAKLVPSGFNCEARTDELTVAPNTRDGIIVGTVGYMSPEQVRGESDRLDLRSDIFSFGATFYEMLTGQRAFRAPLAVETMNAILNDDPLEHAGLTLDPLVARLLRQCLKKHPDERFQSAHDLAFELETVQEVTGSGAGLSSTQRTVSRWGWPGLIAIAVLIIALGSASFFVGRSANDKSLPVFSQLTFRRGTIWSARFAPDEDTIIYSASLAGNPIDVFSTRTGSSESRSLGLPDYSLRSISATGDIVVLRHRDYLGHFTNRGTLARMPIAGTALRPLLNDVQEADWSPDGTNLAIVRHVTGRDRLEYPINKVLYETEGWVSDVRVSPRGGTIAFLDHPVNGDNRGRVSVVDLNGRKSLLSEEWSSVDGLAWAPDESEIWFTARKSGEGAALYAVTLSNKQRLVLQTPTHLKLHDISRSGRVLLSSCLDRTDFFGALPGESKERNLSWLDRGRIRDLSADGNTFIFTYWGAGGSTNYTTYIRKMDGSPAVPLGEGAAWGLSPSGNYVLAILSSPPQIVLLPTDVGESRHVEAYQIEQYGLGASWLPDGEHILFIGREKGQNLRTYVQSINGGAPRAVTPEGITGTVTSPDGKHFVAEDTNHNKFLYSLDGGEARQIDGLSPDDQVMRWSNSPQIIYLYNPKEVPARVYQFDIQTRVRKLWREIKPTDATGILGPIHIFLTSDGKGYIYDFRRYLSELFIVEGLK
ncbi:MAG: WD40 repeat domain-containing serine/threonine protein kinase [Blastocatellia bacterium]